MIDRRLLIDEFGPTRDRLLRKLVDPDLIDRARELLLLSNQTVAHRDGANTDLNRVSKEVQAAKRAGTPDDVMAALLGSARVLSEAAAVAEQAAREALEAVESVLLQLPNLPDDASPDGVSDADNVVVSTSGYDPDNYAGRDWLPHWTLGEQLGILDIARATTMSGPMFSMLRGDGARLLYALVDLGLTLNRDNYVEIVPPHFVSSNTLKGTGHLPKFADDMYQMTSDDLWAIPTGEVPLTSIHAGEILDLGDLPKKYMAYTVCWRREAGSAGKATRGMQRLHEFHKVELVHLCAPEQVQGQFDQLLEDALRPIQLLGLPYRLVDLCAGDLTFSSTRIFDIEVYAPGSDAWLEVSSVGIFGDFQPRRNNSRFRRKPGDKPELLHALNGSALATPRVWSAILENYQQPDGTVAVPEVLQRYMGKDRLGNVR